MKAPVTRKEICDKIKMQWIKYQTKKLKVYWFKKLDDGDAVAFRCTNQCQSCWPQVLHDCGLQAAQTCFAYKRIDSFGQKKILFKMNMALPNTQSCLHCDE